jgi:hypothetical protein
VVEEQQHKPSYSCSLTLVGSFSTFPFVLVVVVVRVASEKPAENEPKRASVEPEIHAQGTGDSSSRAQFLHRNTVRNRHNTSLGLQTIPTWGLPIRLPPHVRGGNEPCGGQQRGVRMSVLKS